MSILNRWKNVCRVNDVGQTEIHIVEPLVPEPSPLQIEIALVKITRYSSNSGRIHTNGR
jgi:hypothetical protein